MKVINAAFDILSDPDKKSAYDRLHNIKSEGSDIATDTPRQSDHQPQPNNMADKDGNDEWHAFPFCQNCNKQAPVKEVSFKQNIGLLFVRFHRHISGYLCKDCIDEYFWKMSIITFFLGWWGVISFFTTPIYLIGNVCSYLGSIRLPHPASSWDKPSNGWKTAGITLLVIMVFGGIIMVTTGVAAVGLVGSNKSTSVNVDQPTAKPLPTSTTQNKPPTKVPTHKPTTKPTSDNNGSCARWSSISLSDVGDTICVYGDVIEDYFRDGAYFMVFDNDPGDFYLIMYGDWGFEGVEGNCVRYTGKVEKLGGTPVMVIGRNDTVYKCN